MDKLHRIRLLLGDPAIKKLKRSTVMVFGCGAVGSFAIESLARCGVGHLILVDFDTVAPSNINRQLFALDSTIGIKKTLIAQQRIFDINPEIATDIIDIFFDEHSDIKYTPDFVIDAIDSVNSKIALYKWCQSNKIKFISSMGAARKTDPTQIQIAKISKTSVCPLASRIRHLIKQNNKNNDYKINDFPVVYSTEQAHEHKTRDKEFGSIVTVTGIFGLMMANYAINYLISKNK